MKFKIDENLPSDWSARLRAAQHDALSVLDQHLGGHPDPEIAAVCISEDRVLVTLDTDFGNILSYPPRTHPGIIVIRTADQSIPALAQLLSDIIAALKIEPVAQRLWIVEKGRIRVRGES
ncbi:MAG: DUF5615 family PIN-like protein [bacterium]